MFLLSEKRQGNSQSSSLRSRGDEVFLFGIGLTGAVTVGLVVLLVFDTVGLVAMGAAVVVVVVGVALLAFLSAAGSGVGFARGAAVAFTGGFAGRFSMLKNPENMRE